MRLRLADQPRLTPLDTKLLPAPIELACAAGEKGPLCDRAAAVKDVAARFGPDAERRVYGLHERCRPGRTPAASTETTCE